MVPGSAIIWFFCPRLCYEKIKNKIEKSKKEKVSKNCYIHLTFSNKQLRWDVIILTFD